MMWAAIHAQRETRGLQRTLWGRYSPWRLARRHPRKKDSPVAHSYIAKQSAVLPGAANGSLAFAT